MDLVIKVRVKVLLFLHYPEHNANVFLTSVVDGSFVGAALPQVLWLHWMK